MGMWTSDGSGGSAVKRKRGRPRKADILAAQAAAGSIEAPPVKRKRGRPRKADILAAAQAVAVGIGAPSVKRKRGRPSKADVLAAAQAVSGGIGVPPVKRKRGRPRKADILAAQIVAGGSADGSDASAANRNADELFSESDDHESLFTSSTESNSSSDSDYEGDDGQTTPNLTQNFESTWSSDSDCDDDDQATPRLGQISEFSSSSDNDYDEDEDDHSSDEDFFLEGHTGQGKIRRRGGDAVKYKESSTGVICHWCRQKSEILHVRCSLCVKTFCPACLLNRHGEKIQEETRSGVRWVCPCCRGGCGPGCENCCNCGPCRRKQGKPPTGKLVRTARDAGFSNVHDYLINLKTGESAEIIASRKEGRGWTYASGAVVPVIKTSPIPPWGMKGPRTPKIPLGFLISKCREGREDAIACEMAEIPQLAVPQSRPSFTDSDFSENPPRISIEAGGTECWRTHGAIPKRNRTTRTRTSSREKREVEHEKRADVGISLRGDGEGEAQAQLPDLNFVCEEGMFRLPDLNSPIMTSDGVTTSDSSRQEITGVTMCTESQCHVPVSTESAQSSVRTLATSANEAEAATTRQATSGDDTATRTLVRADDDFRCTLDLVLQRPFSSEQLKEMWDHFMFHRPAQEEEYMYDGSSNGEADELRCEHFPDLYEKLAVTFSAVEKLKLLRGFFFWLQHSSIKGAFQPWVTQGDDDQYGGSTPISISDSQQTTRAINDGLGRDFRTIPDLLRAVGYRPSSGN